MFGSSPTYWDQRRLQDQMLGFRARELATRDADVASMVPLRQAQTLLTSTQAQVLPEQTAAATGFTRAQTARQLLENQFFPRVTEAGLGLTRAQTGLTQANIGLSRANATEAGARAGLLGTQRTQIQRLWEPVTDDVMQRVLGWMYPRQP